MNGSPIKLNNYEGQHAGYEFYWSVKYFNSEGRSVIHTYAHPNKKSKIFEAGTLTATGDPASGTISIKIENGSVIGSDNVEHTLTLSYSGPITKWQYLPPLKGEKVKR